MNDASSSDEEEGQEQQHASVSLGSTTTWGTGPCPAEQRTGPSIPPVTEEEDPAPEAPPQDTEVMENLPVRVHEVIQSNQEARQYVEEDQGNTGTDYINESVLEEDGHEWDDSFIKQDFREDPALQKHIKRKQKYDKEKQELLAQEKEVVVRNGGNLLTTWKVVNDIPLATPGTYHDPIYGTTLEAGIFGFDFKDRPVKSGPSSNYERPDFFLLLQEESILQHQGPIPRSDLGSVLCASQLRLLPAH
jgi:DNA segregation ATPase FtsK/SpoIIIE-like protein